MHDLEHEIRGARPPSAEVPPLDMDRLHRCARRRRRARTASLASAVLVGIVGVGLAAQAVVGPPGFRIDEPAGGAPPPTAGSTVGSHVPDTTASPRPGGYRTPLLREAVRDQIDEAEVLRAQLLAKIEAIEAALAGVPSEGAEGRRDQLLEMKRDTRLAVEQVDARLVRLHRQFEEIEAETDSEAPQALVPDVVGMNEDEARRQIEQAGMEALTFDKPTTDPAGVGRVTSQSPPAGPVPMPDDADGSDAAPFTVVIQVGRPMEEGPGHR